MERPENEVVEGEEVVEAPVEDVTLETPEEEAPTPVCYAPGEGSMNHPF